jgi:type VI secretion system secreted protein VgrG
MATNLRQSGRIASFVTPSKEDEFSLIDFDAEEGISELFTYRIKAASNTENADLQKLIGENCHIKFTLKNGKPRIFNGILVNAQWLGREDDLQIYQFTLKPWFWLLSYRSDCRIFKDKTALEIIKIIFGKEGKADFHDRAEAPPKIEYCVQYRETDLEFVLRLMEKYGIYYYFKHSEGGHKMILTDSRSGHDPVQAAAEPHFNDAGTAYPFMTKLNTMPRAIEHIGDWSTLRRLRTGKIQLKDYDFKQSGADLTSRAEDGFPKAKDYESYDYPGAYLTRDEGEQLARIRVQSEQARDNRRHATGEAPSLYPGALMTFADHPTGSENGEYLMVSAQHSFSGQSYRSGMNLTPSYHGSYELQKSDKPYRAPITTPGPRVMGPHTAKVVGKDNDETEGDIDVDEYGRILLRFHWDREDKSTSCRVRVAQLWSGKGWGGQIIPRIGQEVIVEFLEGDPEKPLVTGTVVNDKHMPPYELPANKTQSGLKSESTHAGGLSGTYNEIKFEDKDGLESLSLRAEKDHDIEVQNVETRTIATKFSGGEWSRKTTLEQGSDKLDINNGKLDITAAKEIVMKVGESTIRMLPASIEITSPTITIHSTLKTEVVSDATVIVNGKMVLIN